MSKKSEFDATSSALGYIYQVRYALLAALKKITSVADPDDFNISIETLDDVAFDENGDPETLLQTKYHGSPGNITDRSPDIWKTLRVWIESHHNNIIDFTNSSLFLITTETAKENSLAYLLSEDKNKRNISKAIEKLNEITQTAPSNENKSGFEAYTSLTSSQALSLMNNMYIIGDTDDLLKIREQIKANLRIGTSKQYMEAFTTRLEGKWFKLVIEALENSGGTINLGDLVELIDDLREEFLPGNLPADYSDLRIENLDVSIESKVFLQQIKFIGGGDRLIKNALENYYRSYEQRSRWSKDGLVKPGELKKYMKQLKDEWDLQCGILELKYTENSDEDKRLFGVDVYEYCQKEGALPIRAHFTESYVARGAYHALSNCLKIGWHPDYLTLVKESPEQGVA